MICDIVVEIRDSRHYNRSCIRHVTERNRAMYHRNMEGIAVPDRDRDIRRHLAYIRHLVAELLGHFLYDEPALFIRVVTHKNLSMRKRVALRLISFDVRHFGRLYTVRVVYHELGVYAERLVEPVLVTRGESSYTAHCRDTYALKFLCCLASYHPEVGEGPVIPQLQLVRIFIEHSYEVLCMFCDYVHGYFRKIQIRTDTRRCPYSYPLIDFSHQKLRHLFRIHVVSLQISSHIKEDLIYRIDVHVFRRDVVEIYLIYFRSVLHVELHPRRGHDVLKALRDLEYPRPAAYSLCFERRRYRKTNGSVTPGRIRHYKIGGHRIQTTLYAFHRRIERLEIYAYICFFPVFIIHIKSG